MPVEKTLINVVLGVIVASIFGAIAFLLKRVIQQNDKFQENTRRDFKLIRRALEEQRGITNKLRFELEQKLSSAGLDQTTKTKISSLLASVASLEQEIQKLKPVLERVADDHGRVIMIADKVKAQEKKLKGLHTVMTTIVQDRKRSGQ